MSILGGLCNILFGIAGLLSTSFANSGDVEVPISNPEVYSSIRTAYNSSPRNVEECDFPNFVRNYNLKNPGDVAEYGSNTAQGGLREVVICKNDDTLEIVSV